MSRSKLIVRAGDIMRVGDDLRAAITVAETAIALAEQHGAGPGSTRTLKKWLDRIRGA